MEVERNGFFLTALRVDGGKGITILVTHGDDELAWVDVSFERDDKLRILARIVREENESNEGECITLVEREAQA